MNKFNVGDKVKCICGYHSFIEVGQTYTVAKIDRLNVYLENKEFPYFHGYFELAKPVFDMVNEPWFIRTNDEEEFEIAKEFVKSKGFSFAYGEEYQKDADIITNRDGKNRILFRGLGYVLRSDSSTIQNKKEIKLTYINKKLLDKVEYPEIKSKEQLEIEKIESEMRKLADRLKEIKGDLK